MATPNWFLAAPVRRREVIKLYRDVLKTARCYEGNNDAGRPWSEVIAESARAEFEDAKQETDPTEVYRLLITGRDYLMKAQEQLQAAQERMIAAQERFQHRVEETRTDRQP